MTRQPTLPELIDRGRKLLEKNSIPTAGLDAELLLAHCLNQNRLDLYLNPDTPLSPDMVAQFTELTARRAAREPLAYIVGYKEFWSLKLSVNRQVLIPRPETEILVEKTIDIINSRFTHPANLKLLDIGTGSGAIAIALAKDLPQLNITAADRSLDALRVARTNIDSHRFGEQISLFCGDMTEAVQQKGIFDMVVSNPPYIPAREIAGLEPEISVYEPMSALDGGENGLCFYRALAEGVPRILKKQGWLIVEIGDRQAQSVTSLLSRDNQFDITEIAKDYSGKDRVVAARKTEHCGRI